MQEAWLPGFGVEGQMLVDLNLTIVNEMKVYSKLSATAILAQGFVSHLHSLRESGWLAKATFFIERF